MKKGFALFTLIAFLSIGNLTIFAQDTTTTEEVVPTETVTEEETSTDEVIENETTEENSTEDVTNEETFHQIIKQKFMEGGPEFMGIVLLCLILGLALSIERIIYLNMATINSDKLLNDVESLKSGGVDAAKDVCRNTKGPISSIFYQGLDRSNEGLEQVEKSIVAYGSVQMGLLEKGLSWISLFISGSYVRIYGYSNWYDWAFDSIEAAGDISPSLVAGGIKVALLTTVFGLIVFYDSSSFLQLLNFESRFYSKRHGRFIYKISGYSCK